MLVKFVAQCEDEMTIDCDEDSTPKELEEFAADFANNSVTYHYEIMED